MRAAFIASGILHLLILAAAIITLPSSQGFTPPPVAALPIEIITIDEKTDITEGNPEEQVVAMAPAPETVESETEAEPEAMPGATDTEAETIATNDDAIDSQAESSAPDEAGEPEPQPDEAEPVDEVTQEAVPEVTPEPDPVETPPETAAAPEPEPEPAEPEPTETAAAAPEPQPEVVEAPAPAPVPETVVPRSRPQPPRRTRTARQETPPEDTFNADRISSLINRTAPSGGGSGRAQASAGTNVGRADAPQTATFTDALMHRLRECWLRPAAVGQEEELAIVVQFNLTPDGKLERIVDVRARGIGPIFDVAAEAARRAVLKCAPYDWLPADQYDLWRELQVTFDPREFG
ncbi:hypothetical protein [Acuticoccus sp. I52.16.1]|uniref:hypothetical protein n=1 Tax=Acuticoccus sp. I52.16.1 TaxID=2928472 RepID=UPI001FD3E57F|nr:hypothetical protein [Acuticoccus sp. I52.16.1]UOM32831.1 hypothetical protein MRB58_13190 [Acuticoccus sp. I52.16.1]